jgi:alanine dehydrogenase
MDNSIPISTCFGRVFDRGTGWIAMGFLLLQERDIKEILTMDMVIDAVERGFKEEGMGRVQMPSKTYLYYGKHNGDVRCMPCYLEDSDISAIKVVNVHPGNRELFGLPTVMATILLIDTCNGILKSVMGGTWLTAMRTGAASGVATKYLARPDSKVVGMVGTGVQARTQLMALREVMSEIEEVRVTDIKKDMRENFAEIMGKMLKLEITPVEQVKDAVVGSDIVVATVPTREPVIKGHWVDDGAHVLAVGADAPGKEEFSADIWSRAKIVVDDWKQASHSGDINVAISKGLITRKNIWAELGEIVAGKKEGRTSRTEITIFDSTGIAVQDAVVADLAYKEAMKRGMGQELDIWLP